MPAQELFWTALPNGYVPAANALRVSAVVSIRLDPQMDAPELGSFPDFRCWPELVRQAVFTIRYGGAPPVVIAGNSLTGHDRVDDSIGIADRDVWAAMFDAAVPVRLSDRINQLPNLKLVSYPVTDIHDLVCDLYAQLGVKSSDELPGLKTLAADPAWNDVRTTVGRIYRRCVEKLDQGTIFSPDKLFAWFRNPKGAFVGLAGLQQSLAQFMLFHTPMQKPEIQQYPAGDPREKARWRTFRRHALPDAATLVKQIDFHQRVAAMNQYPLMLRKLGLVVDFVITASRFPYSANAPLSVAVELPPELGTAVRAKDPDPAPQTRTRHAAGSFGAVSRAVPFPAAYAVNNGLLTLDNTFALLDLDVDGAGQKLLKFCSSMNHTAATGDWFDPVTKQENQTGAPALRNGGLSLVHTGRAQALAATFANTTSLKTGLDQARHTVAPAVTFYAEDLVRGFRFDIWDDRSRAWHSLCQRRARYRAGTGERVIEFGEVPEEGTVRLASTGSSDPGHNTDLLGLHEAVMTWNGWSLCVPMPGRTIATEAGKVGHTDPDRVMRDSDGENPEELRFRASFLPVKGSLPRLRYGRRYWVRGRVVDLAGNSRPHSRENFPGDAPANHARAYLRWEPVLPPSLALRLHPDGTNDKLREGESMDVLAIRSYNDVPAKNTVPTTQDASRVTVPARTTQREAELHGTMDNPASGGVDAATYSTFATFDAELKTVELPTPWPPPDPGTPPDPTAKSTYAVAVEQQVVPYLPDPLCQALGARFLGLPGFPADQVIPIPVYAPGETWPRARAFTIRVYEKAGELPKFDKPSRTLLIPLPKGVRVTLRLSTLLKKPVLRQFGIWERIRSKLAGQPLPVQQKIIADATSGRHWMLTPWRNVELVHATQKPLLAPDFVNDHVHATRTKGATSATLNFDAPVSLCSTQRVDLKAAWNEPDPDAQPATPAYHRQRQDVAFATRIVDRRYSPLVALTGPRDYTELAPDVVRITRRHHEFGDTRYRRIEYHQEAVSRYREYFELVLWKNGDEMFDDNLKVTGKTVRTWIKNAAPPPALRVLYVVPTFGWRRATAGQSLTSQRGGGGLRVYLDGQWNVTGYGEMLAVVLLPAKFTQDPNTKPTNYPYKNFVTQWGNDPVWQSPYVKGTGPRRGDFPLARTHKDPAGAWLPPLAPSCESDQPDGEFTTTDLAHPAMVEADGWGRVEVAPHDVRWDAERQLWYCDLVLAMGASYYPFVRLALARYQPVSVNGAHLSTIVLADFMQLAPDRWVVVGQPQHGARTVTVLGHTYTDSSGNNEAVSPVNVPGITNFSIPVVSPRSVVEVWVERLDPALGEDFGWKKDETVKVNQDPTKFGQLKPLSFAPPLLAEAPAKVGPAAKVVRVKTPVLWQGTVTLAAEQETGRVRLVVAEYEEYVADDDYPYNTINHRKERRLVYAEHLEL